MTRSRLHSEFTIRGRFTAGETRMDDPNRVIYRRKGLPVWTLNYTRDGAGFFAGPGHGWTSRVGDLVLIEPGVLNDYGPAENPGHWTHWWATFQPPAQDWHRLMAWPERLPGHRLLSDIDPQLLDKVLAGFAELIDLAHSPWPQRDDLGISGLRTMLLWCDVANPDGSRSVLDPRIRAVARRLCQDVEAEHTMDDLAQAVGLSPSRLAHLFRRQVGQSPIAYLEMQRITRACDLLLMDGRPVAEVGAAVGYSDPSYFGRVFRKHLGHSPRAFRQERRGVSADTGQ